MLVWRRSVGNLCLRLLDCVCLWVDSLQTGSLFYQRILLAFTQAWVKASCRPSALTAREGWGHRGVHWGAGGGACRVGVSAWDEKQSRLVPVMIAHDLLWTPNASWHAEFVMDYSIIMKSLSRHLPYFIMGYILLFPELKLKTQLILKALSEHKNSHTWRSSWVVDLGLLPENNVWPPLTSGNSAMCLHLKSLITFSRGWLEGGETGAVNYRKDVAGRWFFWWKVGLTKAFHYLTCVTK